MAKLKELFKEIKKASRGHKMVSVGIDFGSSSIKMVQLMESGGVVSLKNYGEISLGPFAGKPDGSVANLSNVKLEDAMRQLLNNVPVNDPEAVAVSIPLSATLVLPLEFQATSMDDLKRKIIDEVKKHIPVPLEQVFLDWQVVNEPHLPQVSSDGGQVTVLDESEGADSAPSGTLVKVLAFIVNKEIIDTYRQVLENNGIKIEYYELEIYSVLRSALKKGSGKAVVIDIGAKYTKFYSIVDGSVTGAVKKLHGGIDLTQVIKDTLQTDMDKAESLKRNLNLSEIPNQELRKKLESSIESLAQGVNLIKKEAGFPADENIPVYLSGGGTLLYGLPEFLAEKLQAKIIICQPFINAQAPEFLNQLLVETGPEYSVAAGLALKHLTVV